jgi:hypothetical protein
MKLPAGEQTRRRHPQQHQRSAKQHLIPEKQQSVPHPISECGCEGHREQADEPLQRD